MKKNLLIRSLIGAPIGLTVSMIVTIIVSLCAGHGEYYPVPQELVSLCGNTMNAVLVQTACALVCGAAFGGASVVWDMEKWSLLKQTLIHFAVVTASSFPIAFFTYWIPHRVYGALIYVGIFIAVYAAVWISVYLSVKAKIKKLNDGLHTDDRAKR